MFEWKDEFKVGVSKIDEQHKKLFSLLKDLYDATRVGHGRDVVVKVLQGVVSYTKEHFATEEKFMTELKYPEYDAHKKMHDSLVHEAGDLMAKAQQGRLTVSIDVMKFLEGWIAHHISAADSKLGTFLKAKGVK